MSSPPAPSSSLTETACFCSRRGRDHHLSVISFRHRVGMQWHRASLSAFARPRRSPTLLAADLFAPCHEKSCPAATAIAGATKSRCSGNPCDRPTSTALPKTSVRRAMHMETHTCTTPRSDGKAERRRRPLSLGFAPKMDRSFSADFQGAAFCSIACVDQFPRG